MFKTMELTAWNNWSVRLSKFFMTALMMAALTAASNVRGGTTTNANFYVNGGVTREIAVGDKEVVTDNFRVGNYVEGTGTLNLYGELDIGNFTSYVGYGSDTTGVLEMAEGSYLSCTGNTSFFIFGGRSGNYGHGILRQSGGVLHTRNLHAGNMGSADLTLSGGEIIVDNNLTFNPGSGGSTFRILNGALSVNNIVYFGYNQPITPKLVVSGGVFRATTIYMGSVAGSSGATWLIDGGSNVVERVYVGYAAGSTGTIIMSDGYFECNDLIVGDGSVDDLHGRLTLRGGKIVMNSTLAVANTGGDGVVVIEGTGELDLVHKGLTPSGSTMWKIGVNEGSITNRNGGTLRWQYALGNNGGAANIVNTNATLALRDIADGNVTYSGAANSFGRIVKQAGSRLALENSTNTLIAGTFDLKEANNSYQSLILREGTPCWQSDTLAIQTTGELVVSNTSAAVVSAQVNNSGRILVADATGTFADDVTILPDGYVCGTEGAVLRFNGDFLNGSTNSALFDLSASTVIFTGGGDHVNAVMGNRKGDFLPENYAYGTLRVEAGNDVYFTDGDGAGNKGLYVGHVDLADQSAAAVTLLHSAFDIYYQPAALEARNTYLNNQSYALDGGGHLRPFPTPGTVINLK